MHQFVLTASFWANNTKANQQMVETNVTQVDRNILLSGLCWTYIQCIFILFLFFLEKYWKFRLKEGGEKIDFWQEKNTENNQTNQSWCQSTGYLEAHRGHMSKLCSKILKWAQKITQTEGKEPLTNRNHENKMFCATFNMTIDSIHQDQFNLFLFYQSTF